MAKSESTDAALAREAEALYGLPASEYTKARNARAKELRPDEPELAAVVAKLPKPSAAAAAVNRLARDEPSEIRALVQAGRRLREAQEAAWRGLADRRAGLILGPPGTGKTHLLSWLITGFAQARRRRERPARVLVTAFTRNAIGNVLDAVAARPVLVDGVALVGVEVANHPGAI